MSPLPVVNTYRLQMHRGFTFRDAAALASYLADLGVTHLYLSPITQAAPGSTHGYDVTDPTRLNPELGGEEGYAQLVEVLRQHGLGQVVDTVPNHMGIAAAGNEYWRDVLRHGPSSRHARIFDIDWTAHIQDGRPRVVLPVLGDTPEEAVARGEITVDEAAGELVYFAARFPLSPESLEWWRSGERTILELLDRQHYRLADWRTGKREANYRRFFEVDDLIGVRSEDPEVYALMHERLLALVADGAVDGLRINHPDGLRDPEEYLRRLARDTPMDTPVFVEKILAADEPLPDGWLAAGTSGYDAMNDFIRVQVNPAAEEAFTDTYATLSGEHAPFEDVAALCRADVLGGSLSGQFDRLGRRLHAAAGGDIEERAFLDAFRAVLAHIPVYRTYHTERSLDPRAHEVVGEAFRHARRDVGGSAALDAVARLLEGPPSGETREAVLSLQQIMPAIQAKGLEDRAFYRYRRLLALTEVGGDPALFGSSVEQFHTRMAEVASRWPGRMLATATHDHKRGEDARARLAALSEFPDEWAGAAARAFEGFRKLDDRGSSATAVHPSDLYLILQTALASLPLGMDALREDPDPVARLGEYLGKALREAGERTAWLQPDESYERAVIDLATRAFGDPGSPVAQAVTPLFENIARVGAINALSQLVLKLGAPGVADTYQGNELWDLSLVDPDNRRQPDYDEASRILESLSPALVEGDAGDEARRQLTPDLLATWRDGRIKMFVTARGLRARSELAEAFLDGTYRPLEVRGEHADRVVTFEREGASSTAVVVVPRLTRAINAATGDDLWRPAWGDTTVGLGAIHDAPAVWSDILTGARHAAEPDLPLDRILGAFPVAILIARR